MGVFVVATLRGIDEQKFVFRLGHVMARNLGIAPNGSQGFQPPPQPPFSHILCLCVLVSDVTKCCRGERSAAASFPFPPRWDFPYMPAVHSFAAGVPHYHAGVSSVLER